MSTSFAAASAACLATKESALLLASPFAIFNHGSAHTGLRMSNVGAAAMLFVGQNQTPSREQRMRLSSGSYSNKRGFVHVCHVFTRNELR
jgi:hypothetical protein